MCSTLLLFKMLWRTDFPKKASKGIGQVIRNIKKDHSEQVVLIKPSDKYIIL